MSTYKRRLRPTERNNGNQTSRSKQSRHSGVRHSCSSSPYGACIDGFQIVRASLVSTVDLPSYRHRVPRPAGTVCGGLQRSPLRVPRLHSRRVCARQSLLGLFWLRLVLIMPAEEADADPDTGENTEVLVDQEY